MARLPAQRLVTLLTGERGAGKSTVCLRIGELARAAGPGEAGIAGIASRGRYEAGEQAGLDAVDLASGQEWPLASAVERLGGPVIGRFSFSPSGLSRALERLYRAVASGARLIVLDEVGPLEILRREGFYPFLESLRRRPRPDLLLVVRPALLDDLRALFGSARLRVVAVTPENRDALPEDLTRPSRPV
jgi:nucleoside-triphosphatase THEP1